MGKGRAPCCDKSIVKKGPWTPEEDTVLISHIQQFGHPNWRALPAKAGLLRCGKSCRLRWMNYLRPDVKRGNFTLEEEETIINLNKKYGNRWSKIASKLPGRTDNEIKNVWNTYLKKRLEDNTNSSSSKSESKTTTGVSTSLSSPSSATSTTVSRVEEKLKDLQSVEETKEANVAFQTGPNDLDMELWYMIESMGSFADNQYLNF